MGDTQQICGQTQQHENMLESMVANDETLGQEETSSRNGQTNQSAPERQNPSQENQQTGSSPGSATDRGTSRENPGLKRGSSYYTPYMEDRLCRKLKFHFMGPHEKITARRKCPWKLIMQVLKIILVTAQLIQFGYNRSSFVDFAAKTTLAMKNIYLKDWTNAYETMPYPPAIGIYALYKIDQITDHVNYAMKSYSDTADAAIASLYHYKDKNGTARQMRMCVKQYRGGEINDTTNMYSIDSKLTNDCYDIGKLKNGSYNIVEYLKVEKNVSLDVDFFNRLLSLHLKFSLKSFRLDMNERSLPPQLYCVDVIIALDDSSKDGQMAVTLTTTLTEIDIEGHSSNEDAELMQRIGLVIFDSSVLLITVLSFVLCGRSIIRAQKLKRKTMKFFKHRYGKDLSFSDRFEFLNLWYVTIIINDVLTIVGTGYKIQLETRNLESSSDNYDICGLMLGTGSLLAWIGVLRYIGFFNQFNILIITLKKAFPRMLRFLTCCFMLYMGFVICGWVVLGPYHIKFREMSTASECLFSLINGDDMFTTFSALITKNQVVWYYSRVYLYTFISLFIYAVLNLFIAVILDAYETIKEYYKNGFPKSELFEFIDRCQDPTHSPLYRHEDSSCNPVSVLCCCCRQNADRPTEHTPLIS